METSRHDKPPPTGALPPTIRRNQSAEPHEAAKITGHVCAVLDGFGIHMSPSKVSRLVHRYLDQVARNGYTLAEWLVNSLALDAEKRRTVTAELSRVIAYADPVGETAVRNVMKGRP